MKPGLRAVVVAAAVAAALLMVLPVDAIYLNKVGSHTLEFRTASCGVPVVSLLGADPGLGGGSFHRIGGETARTACDAAAGKRVIVGQFLLLATLAGALAATRRGRRRVTEDDAVLRSPPT